MPARDGMIRRMAIEAAVEQAIFARHPDYVAAILVAEGIVNGPSDADERRALARRAHVRERGLERAADHPRSPRGAPRSARSAPSRVATPARRRRSPAACSRAGRCRASTASSTSTTRSASAISSPSEARTSTGSTARCGSPSPRATSASTRPAASSTRAGGDRLARRRGRHLPALELAPGPRTRLTEATTRAFFVFDRLGALAPAALEAAIAELTERLAPARAPTASRSPRRVETAVARLAERAPGRFRTR